MRFIDEYRDGDLATELVRSISVRTTRPWVMMEICGGQTHTIMKYGIEGLLPHGLSLIHGPGCPVCVTPLEMIDRAISISLQEGVVLCSFGDMLRVPGSSLDLLAARAAGADVRIVYSPLEAVKIAEAFSSKTVVLFGVGFETTAPANAMAVKRARELGLTNFFLLSSHVLVPPAVRLILSSKENRIQGLLAAGHVCTIMGYTEYELITRDFGIPVVVTGFEPVDILQGIGMIVRQLEDGRAEMENQYGRIVRREGNVHARKLMEEVFEVTDRPWRGIGVIPSSGLRLRQEYASFDAEEMFDLKEVSAEESPLCIAGEILQGRKKPFHCTAFDDSCTPLHPLGAPMVSSEGACAAYYRYARTSIPGLELEEFKQ